MKSSLCFIGQTLFRKLTTFGFFVVLLGTVSGFTQAATGESNESTDNIKSAAIDNVWSGHRIKPYLLTRGVNQFVAYFDANRQITVAHRRFGSTWRYYKVDSWLGWDSHNYVTMELDKAGNLHVMGNMHADPIEYFRTSEPFNIRSLKRVSIMVDSALERKMTYLDLGMARYTKCGNQSQSFLCSKR